MPVIKRNKRKRGFLFLFFSLVFFSIFFYKKVRIPTNISEKDEYPK